MKFSVDREILLNGIQTVQNIITPKTILPVLSNILLETQEQGVRLTATDLDVGITRVIPVNIQEPGVITIPAKRFSDIIKESPSGNINICTKKNNIVTIETGLCQFKIMGLSHEEFPKLPEFKDKKTIQLEQSIFKQLLKLTSFAVSLDESRYALNGVFFKIEDNNLILVATDGKRLATIKNPIQQNINNNTHFIIPIKTVQELNRNLKDDGEMSLVIGGNQVLFDLGGVVIVSRLIEGEFPDYQQVIPSPYEYKITINREQFLLAIRRAALLSTPDYQAIKLEVFKEKLVISKSTPDIGESREELSVRYKGREIVVGFNPVYLMDVLKNIPGEDVEFEIVDAEKPGVVRTDNYIYIVLPMRLA